MATRIRDSDVLLTLRACWSCAPQGLGWPEEVTPLPIGEERRKLLSFTDPGGEMSPHQASRTGDEARLGQLEELDRQVRRIRQTVTGLTASAESPDGLIDATVGVYGELVELVLDPRVYREPNADTLAESIMATVNEARETAQSDVRRELAQCLPPELSNGLQTDSIDPAGLAFEPLQSLIAHRRGKGTIR
jgi:DNA-binding protein YbaB